MERRNRELELVGQLFINKIKFILGQHVDELSVSLSKDSRGRYHPDRQLHNSDLRSNSNRQLC